VQQELQANILPNNSRLKTVNKDDQMNRIRSRAARAVSSKTLLILFAIVSLCFVSDAIAQTGSITGLVTDASGAVVGGAKVTVVSNTTGVTREVITGGGGSYSLVDLQPTAYTLTVQKSGFQETVFKDVNVTVGEVVPLNAKLQVGTATTEISVNAVTEAPIETDTYQFSTIIDSQAINNLPLILRDPYQLVLLSPGVVSYRHHGGSGRRSGERRTRAQ
jgi:hypothetical protein